MALFALVPHPWVAGATLALSGAGLIAFISTANTQIQLGVPDALRGRVMGVWGLVFGGGLPLGSILLGALAEKFGIQVALATGAGVCFLVSVIVFLNLPPRQDPAGPPPDQGGPSETPT
jgi:MFS family permease